MTLPISIEALRDTLGDHAKDIRLNLGNVLTADGAPGLTASQVLGIALASAYATRNNAVIAAIAGEADATLAEAEKNAAKAAATIMAMNNIYYRFIHLVHDDEIKALPAKLRMNVIGNPGIPKVDFELYALAVSAINGCGMCMETHAHELGKNSISKQGIQSAVRIAAVINAAAQALV
ncbi:MAG: carboxymuconolactone decarboxylase family protein [Holosporales bacterium]|jgi:alkyl hydroperoxide reductase subunit D